MDHDPAKKNILQRLTSLGGQFAVGHAPTPPDPEQTIVDALSFFWTDKKVFSSMICLLKFRIHQLINTQRLYSKSKLLDADHRILLAVVAAKVYQYTKDERFLILSKKMRCRSKKLSKYPKSYSSPFYKKRRGIDKEFKKFGAELADFFSVEEKKFNSLAKIYSGNSWLMLRALVGTDYRADVIYFKTLDTDISQTKIVKKIGCNKSSVSRIWNSTKGVEQIAHDLINSTTKTL